MSMLPMTNFDAMIFVTGATGLLGSHLIYRLAREGKQVRALKRSTSSLQDVKILFEYLDPQGSELFQKIEWVEGDVTDLFALSELMEGCDEVYHLAAIVSYHKKDRQKMYEVNVGGTANVVNTALEKNIRKFCFVSSIATFGRIHHMQVITENSKWTDGKLHTHYGISKHLAEMEVWRAEQEGMKAVIVNPGLVIGPGSFERSSPTVFQKINQGLPYYPTGSTGMVGVNDVVKVMIQLMNSEIQNEQFIIVNKNYSFRELFQLVCKELGKKPPQKEAPLWLLHTLRIGEWLAEMVTGRRALITKESLKNTTMVFIYENKKLKEKLHFEFEELDLAIKTTSAYFKKLHH